MNGYPAIPTSVVIGICITILVAFLAFPLMRIILNRRYNPNRSDKHQRLLLGQKMAVLESGSTITIVDKPPESKKKNELEFGLGLISLLGLR